MNIQRIIDLSRTLEATLEQMRSEMNGSEAVAVAVKPKSPASPKKKPLVRDPKKEEKILKKLAKEPLTESALESAVYGSGPSMKALLMHGKVKTVIIEKKATDGRRFKSTRFALSSYKG